MRASELPSLILEGEVNRLRAINAEMDKGAEAVIAERDRLRAINAELVAALEEVRPAIAWKEAYDKVQAAIAKAKPETT